MPDRSSRGSKERLEREQKDWDGLISREYNTIYSYGLKALDIEYSAHLQMNDNEIPERNALFASIWV